MSFRGGVQMFRDSKISTMNELIIKMEPVQHYPSIMSLVQYYPSMRQPVQHYPSIILEKSHIECFILNLWKYENLWVLVLFWFCYLKSQENLWKWCIFIQLSIFSDAETTCWRAQVIFGQDHPVGSIERADEGRPSCVTLFLQLLGHHG